MRSWVAPQHVDSEPLSDPLAIRRRHFLGKAKA
jgi:hypothetical protein